MADATSSLRVRRGWPGRRLVRPLGRWMLRRSPYLRALLFGLASPAAPASYRIWAGRNGRLTPADQTAIRAHVAALPPRLISLVMPLDSADARHAVATLSALRGQCYPHWELCIAAADPSGARALAVQAADPRIRVLAAGPEDMLAATRGEFVAVLPPDALLAPHALYEVAAALAAHPDSDLLYTDEDRLDARGRRRDPICKTGWSPELLLGQNALGDLAVIRRDLLRRAGGLGALTASGSHDRALRVAEAVEPARVHHIPAVLVHRQAPGGPAPADAAAVARHLQRSGVAGARVEAHPQLPGCLRVVRPLPEPAPLVSVIVPTRDHAALLARCAEGVLARTDYPAIELIVVDNGSVEPATAALLAKLRRDARVRVLADGGPFNYARLNNRAAQEARGEVLVLLNDDVEVIASFWLRELVAHAMRPEVGAVGARLLYPDGRVQHGGVALGVRGIAAHLEPLAPREAPGYGGRLWLARDVAAVTGACLALRRAVYLEVGGLDEDHLPVAYNDTDLCLRLREQGRRVIYTPFAELVHHESASRASDTAPDQIERCRREVAYMQRRWGAALVADPFYGPNFSLADGHYTLAAPRRTPPWEKEYPQMTRIAADETELLYQRA